MKARASSACLPTKHHELDAETHQRIQKTTGDSAASEGNPHRISPEESAGTAIPRHHRISPESGGTGYSTARQRRGQRCAVVAAAIRGDGKRRAHAFPGRLLPLPEATRRQPRHLHVQRGRAVLQRGVQAGADGGGRGGGEDGESPPRRKADTWGLLTQGGGGPTGAEQQRPGQVHPSPMMPPHCSAKFAYKISPFLFIKPHQI